MIKLKHILLEQRILGPNIDIRTGKPIAMANPGREFAPMLFDPKVAAKQLVAVKSHPKSTIPAEIKNIIFALPDANAYNTLSIDFKKMAGMTLPEFIFKYGLPTDTNGAVSFLNNIKMHLTKIKCSPLFITPYNNKIKELTTKLGLQLDDNAVADTIVKMMKKANSGGGTDEQGILDALMLIKNSNIYNNVLTLIKKQPIGEFESADIMGMNDPVWERLGGRRWNTVMQWIQIKEFTPLMSDDKIWLSKYSKILKQFNPNEVVGMRQKGDASNTDPASVAGDTIGSDSTAWDDPEFRTQFYTTVGIATSFIPIVGWAVSAGVFALDSADQYKQGNMREAGLAAVFAAIPLIGKPLGLLVKMPAVARLGERGMAALGEKLAMSGEPVLSAIERLAIKETWKQQYFIKNGIDKYMRASLANQITNSAARDQIRRQLGARGANVIFGIADGSIKASVFGAKVAAGIESLNVGIEGYQHLFDKYYMLPTLKAKRDAMPDLSPEEKTSATIPIDAARLQIINKNK
jgi:hypothetical protein